MKYGGPSPRGRGNLRPNLRHCPQHGTIPARAGQPPQARAPATPPADHPRAGGATAARRQSSMSIRGPSPRGRGNPGLRWPDFRRCGTIPARAGQPTAAVWGMWIRRDHPRAGGATWAFLAINHALKGPSPRGRGNRELPDPQRNPDGTIPARAGQPFQESVKSHVLRDHPRAGGATPNRSARRALSKGPSPRGRGNLHRARQGQS